MVVHVDFTGRRDWLLHAATARRRSKGHIGGVVPVSTADGAATGAVCNRVGGV